MGGAWPSIAAAGTFALYLFGYLALRFRLTFLGIGTDLAVLDERYFYEGAKFVVYLVSAVPSLLLIALVLGAVIWAPYRLFRGRRAAAAPAAPDPERAGARSSAGLAVAGIGLGIVMIQFVLRQPFLFSNLLVAPALPAHAWLVGLLLTEEEGIRALYFAGLVVATAVTVAIAAATRDQAQADRAARTRWGLLVLVAAIQFLFLPVNYGFLITATPLPRVTSLGGAVPPPAGQDVWLAWEGKEGVTYLVRDRTGGEDRRALVTLLRKDVSRIEIVGYDPILRGLFAAPGPAATGAAQR